ncbi:MAG: CIA30 family protein [Cyanobacteria bacterium J06621_3]
MSVNKNTQWDLVRFLTTLNTFGEIPFLGSFRWLQTLLGQQPTFPGRVINVGSKKVVVIDTLPSPLSTLCQEALNQEALGQRLSDIAVTPYSLADLRATQQARSPIGGSGLCDLTLTADTVILCDRLDVDESDFESDFLMLMNELATCLSKNSDVVLERVFDFSQRESDLAAWGALDDVVMGGVSEGSFALRPNSEAASLGTSNDALTYSAVFSGYVSTDNSGGFSSVRTRNFEPAFNFEGCLGLRLRVKGDGQRYKFILRNSEGWDSPAYIYSFDTRADEWMEIDVPFDALVPTFRAKSMPDAPSFDPAKTVSIQLMLSKFEYDRQLNPHFSPGPFALVVSDISAYRSKKGIPLIVVGATTNGATQGKALLDELVDELGISYRWIDSEAADWEDSVRAALN